MDEQTVLDQEPELKSRRTFLQAVIGVFSALVGLFLGIPFVAALVGSSRRAGEREFSEVTALDSLPVGRPVQLVFQEIRSDAFIRREVMRHVWAVRTAGSEVTVYSPICPHLGCAFDWDAPTSRFLCPCHASVYTSDGKVVAGPAPRPLDTLATEVRHGRLLVRWEQFRPGIAQKTRV
jgi:menaquinol-cytochrome c reductase iron-sulfur subunit